MSLFKQLAGANGIIEWTNENKLKLKNELRKRFLKDPQLDISDVDKFLSDLEDKVGSTKWGPSNGINEKEMQRELKELKEGQKDPFNRDKVARIEQALFGA